MHPSLYNSFCQNKRYIFSPEIPLINTTIAQCDTDYRNNRKYEFTENYRARVATEWSPYSTCRPDPPLLIQNSEIHHRHVGHVPNYGGYIPGAIFRCGKTYGNDTKDAKRWIRGDFS